MKAITETDVREQLVRIEPEQFIVPRGRILTPAARDFLNMRKIRIVMEGQSVSRPQSYRARETGEARSASAEPSDISAVPARARTADPAPKARYRDYVTGAPYANKPEYMTQLYGNMLVRKDHPRIECRGRMDSLQAKIVRVQADMAQRGEAAAVIADLQDVLGVLREIMRCDVLDEPFVNERIIGLDHAALRDHSHHPQKYYKIRQMLLPDHTMGQSYAELNEIRAAIRETEVAALKAFTENGEVRQPEILECFNRLSSALHIMMCKYLAGAYGKDEV